MAVQDERRLLPENIQQRQDQLLNTLFGILDDPSTPDVDESKAGLIDEKIEVPQRTVEQLSQDELDAATRARQGLGAFQPFIDTANLAQQAGLGATQLGTSVLQGSQFEPTAANIQRFMDPYQQSVTQEAIKEIDRQAAMAENKLAGDAVRAGAFGGSRFGIAQSELARSAQDLRSRRIFEDMSRNFQQAQQAAQTANQQRTQAAQVFGQLGTQASRIGQDFAQLGGQQQAGTARDVQMQAGIGSLERQINQAARDAGVANLLAQEQAPFDRLSFGSNVLAQQSPFVGSTQTLAPLSGTSPLLQAAGAVGGIATGLGQLIG
jgi:hypothetical protein